MKHPSLPPPHHRAKSAGVRTCLVLLVGLIHSVDAQIFAHMETTRGIINIQLHFEEAPLTVANFITLADGSRSRIDDTTGIVTNTPLYIGEKFFRTADNTFTKFAQTGSGTGTNTGGPGYTIRDEFAPSLRHTGYRLSMANTGIPNSGSAQLFLTGNIATPSFDDLHTILGTVVSDDNTTPGNTKMPGDPTSRTVVDNIIVAGANQTTITGLTFTRAGASALAFNEHGQSLPIVTQVTGTLDVLPQISVEFTASTPLPGRTALVQHQSVDLQSWSRPGEYYPGPFTVQAESYGGYDAPPRPQLPIDDASEKSAFYRFSEIQYPLSVTPDSLANHTVAVDASSISGLNGDYVAIFDGTGFGGTLTFTPDNPSMSPIEGGIIDVYHDPRGDGANLIIVANGLTPILLQMGYDDSCSVNPGDSSVNPPTSPIAGRHKLFLYSGSWQERGASGVTITF